jgi:sugar lactone lactonase YvrE
VANASKAAMQSRSASPAAATASRCQSRSAVSTWSLRLRAVWIFSPAGKHLGTIHFPEIPANCHWGDADGTTLYVTARTSLYRIRLSIEGIRP